MKNLQLRSGKQIDQLITRILLILVTIGFFGSAAYSQITNSTPSSRCGEGTLVLSATAASGNIKWYDVPFYGTPVGTGTTFTTPVLTVTKTYYVDAVDVSNCSLNSGGARVQVIATISASSIQAIIFYESNTFCKSVVGARSITRTGTAGGTYTVTPLTGLTLDASTGSITPGTSATGIYTVTYTVTAAAGCTENPASTDVTITTAPVAPVISYAGTPFCTTAGAVNVTHTGADGGNYTASPSGLTINSSSGTITPATSSSGTYTITYFVPGAGGCAPQTATTTVTILQLPTAAISYASPTFTKNQGSQPVILTGTGIFTGGLFSSAIGLTIDASTGAINPTTSTAGIYTVTYTLSAASPCAQVTASTSVTIYPLPAATISGSATVCKNTANPVLTFTGANGTPPYTFIYKVNGGFDQAVTTVSGNSVTVAQATSATGTYIYTLVSVTDNNASSNSIAGQTATITISNSKAALFAYPATPYCSNAANPSPSFIDIGQAGTFTSSSANLKFVSATTGVIDLSTSIPGGPYTVTNTIFAADNNGCGDVVASADITITRLPVTTFSYPGTPYCPSVTTNAVPTAPTDAGVFTANDLAVVFASGVGVTPGTIDAVLTPAGTYVITNTVIAAGNCAQVSSTASITVLTPPAMNISRLFSTCNGTSPDIALVSNPTGATFSWILGLNPGNITGAIAGSGPTINQVLTNPINNQNGSIEYIVTPTRGSGACSVGSPFTVALTVGPALQLSSTLGPAAICSGTTFVYTASSNAPVSPTFAWTRATIAGITETGATGTGNISETLTNTTNSAISVIYSYITSSDGCSGTPQNVEVTVNPTVLGNTSGSAVSICNNTSTTLTGGAVTGGSGAYAYLWESSTDGSTGWAAATETNTGANYTTTVLTTASTQLYFRRTVISGGCTDIAPAVKVTVYPITDAPTGIATQTFCSGS